MKTKLRRRNSMEGAEELSEAWLGRQPSRIREVTEELKVRTDLADLGGLEELVVQRAGAEYVLPFGHDVRLAAAPPPKGENRAYQLYFIGGDQRLNLASLDIEEPRDLIELGRVASITYSARKQHLENKQVPWQHEFGEEEKKNATVEVLPVLIYDRLNHQLSLAGGRYYIRLDDYDGQYSAGIRN